MKPELYLSHPNADFWADFSFVDFPDDYLQSMESSISSALQAMHNWRSGVSPILMKTAWSDTTG